MKILNLMKLGFKDTITFKKSAIALVSVFGIIFGILLGIHFVTCDLYDQFVGAGLKTTNGRVVTKTSLCEKNNLVPEVCEEAATKIAKEYNGANYGAVITYTNSNKHVRVISSKTAAILKIRPLYAVSKGKIPVVVSTGYEDSLKDKFEDDVLSVVGKYPSIAITPQLLGEKGIGAAINSFAQPFGETNWFYIILHDDQAVSKFLAENGYIATKFEPVFVFDNLSDAYKYYKADTEKVSELFTGSLKTKEVYDKKFSTITYTAIVIFILGFVVLNIFIVLGLKKDKEKIMLYRSLGASNKDLRKIYLSKALMFVGAVAIISLFVGWLFMSITKACYAETVSNFIKEFFGV